MTAFLLALLIAGGSTYLISMRLRPRSAGPGTISIVAAAKDLSAGVPLTAPDLTLVNWPDNLPLDGSLRKVEDAVGRPLLVSMAANQPLLQRQLAAPGSGFGLAGKIPDGMRATAVRSNDVVGVAGFLYPGSHLDVVATRTGGDAQAFTQTVLQDVEVLTTGTATEPDPQGKPQTVAVVTLLLSPEDSQKLLLASAQSSIQFVLRSGVDQQKVDIAPTKMDHLFGDRPAPPTQIAATAPVRPAPPKPEPAKVVTPPPPPPVVEAPKPPEPYIIEVIQGTQRTNQKF